LKWAAKVLKKNSSGSSRQIPSRSAARDPFEAYRRSFKTTVIPQRSKETLRSGQQRSLKKQQWQ